MSMDKEFLNKFFRSELEDFLQEEKPSPYSGEIDGIKRKFENNIHPISQQIAELFQKTHLIIKVFKKDVWDDYATALDKYIKLSRDTEYKPNELDMMTRALIYAKETIALNAERVQKESPARFNEIESCYESILEKYKAVQNTPENK